MNRVCVIEVNEVPNSVLDAYARQSPLMARFLEESDRYTTICADQIQLDPWIAWPTFYRGVPDTIHGLLRLGQDTAQIDTAYPPVWQVLKDSGVSVGICGSLFSGGEQDHSDYRFMLPDVFAAHSKVKPFALEKFQAFNLSMTRASARNAARSVASGGSRAIAELALKGWLSVGTLRRAAGQLIVEKLNQKRLSRRRNIQAELYGDLFCSLLERERPEFSTYYTNNVAAAMHRFWSASFEESSINKSCLTRDWLDEYSGEVFVALQSVERILRRVLDVAGFNTTIVLASAIGQEEIPATNHAQFLTIVDPEAFVAAMLDGGRAGSYRLLPAMVPDFTFRFERSEDATLVCQRLNAFKVGDCAAIETLERMSAKKVVGAGTPTAHIRHDYRTANHFKLPITFGRSDNNTVHVSLQIDDYAGPTEAELGNRSVNFAEIGLGAMKHDEAVNCTAQHCAEGSLVVHRPGMTKGAELRVVSSLDFVPSVLQHFGVERAAYLAGDASIQF